MRDRVITISARRANGVEIRVSDNGPGIPPENLEKIFQPFFSTKSPTAADSGGHGLGLALCRQIATQLGGEISVSSKPGRGRDVHRDIAVRDAGEGLQTTKSPALVLRQRKTWDLWPRKIT